MSEKLTTEAAAKALGITPGRVRQMVLDGSLKAEKFGSNLAIDSASVEAAKNRKTKPGPAPAAETKTETRPAPPPHPPFPAGRPKKANGVKKRTTKGKKGV
jgi:excisionase family DNA binding protein